MKIVADSHIPYLNDYFGACGELVLRPGRIISPEDVRDADMLLVRSVTHVDSQLLKNSSVKFVGSVTAGADHLDTTWMDEAGIAWSVAVGFNAPPVADYVLSVIAALQRKQVLSQDEIKATVIGVGNVGRLVVERLKWLGVDVTLCDPIRAELENDFVSVSLDAIADQDIILLHVPLIKSGDHATYHFIDKHFLQRQKPECVLLNASRGSVIDTGDLIEFGTHLYWCFDVWEHEPKINKAILERAMIATPHIAGYSVQSKMRGTKMIHDIACEKGLISSRLPAPIDMPHQHVRFAGGNHHWQDVALGVFNPIVMTAMMRAMLLPSDDYGHLFDEMRVQFNYRHELAYTSIDEYCLVERDLELVRRLGVNQYNGSPC